MLDYRYLKAFQSAARHLNFSNAARELGISVSALSRQIALLEESAGEELFIRNTRKVMLTPRGKKLMASTARFEQELTGMQADPVVRIGCLQSVFEFVLLDIIERHPAAFDVPLDIEIGTPAVLEERLASGELDLILTNLAPSTSSGLSGFRLYKESFCWFGNSSRSRRPIIFSAFEHAYPEEASRAPNRIRINSYNATIAMTRRKMGWALIAMPTKMKLECSGQGVQWIQVVTPSYRRVPDSIARIVAVLRREAE